MRCAVCGSLIDHATHQDGGGHPVCDRCYALPCLWMPDRPDCIAFAAAVRRSTAQSSAWGISDLRVGGRMP